MDKARESSTENLAIIGEVHNAYLKAAIIQQCAYVRLVISFQDHFQDLGKVANVIHSLTNMQFSEQSTSGGEGDTACTRGGWSGRRGTAQDRSAS